MSGRPEIVRPEILDRIPESGPVLLEASAGTGKTYTLESLVVHLLAGGEATVDQILVVTFTEKATEELRQRVRTHLEHRAAGPDLQSWPLSLEARERLAVAAERFETATIDTIHGFCSRVLADNAFEYRRRFDEELVDGTELQRLAFREVVRETLASSDPLGARLRQGLADTSWSQLEGLVGELVAQEGPISPRWDPEALAAAAQGLLAALEPLHPALLAAYRNHHGTKSASHFAGWTRRLFAAARALTDGAEPLPKRAVELADTLIELAAKPSGQTYLDRLAALPEAGSGPARDLMRAVDQMLRWATPAGTHLALGLVTATRARLARMKADRGLRDFDDLLRSVRDALYHPDHGERLAASLRRRYRFALIDEFQDTDRAQWAIFRRLFLDSPDGHRLFLIGDPKQAIYGFRQADLATYLAAREEIASRTGPPLRLTRNFRSTPRLVEVSNLLFRDFFEGGIEFPEAVSGRPRRDLVATDGRSLPPLGLLAAAPSRDLKADLPELVAVEIHRLVVGREAWLQEGEARRALRYRDIQVLTATRDEATRVGEALLELNLPYSFYREQGLLETPEAHDLGALLEAIAEPHRRPRVARALLTPFFGYSLSQVARLGPEAIAVATDQLVHWQALARSTDLATFFARVLTGSGVRARTLFLGDPERRLTNYEHLAEILSAEGERSGLGPLELARRLEQLRASCANDRAHQLDLQRLDTVPDAVQILTVHRAKGLEAPIVFLAGGLSSPGSDRIHPYVQNGERWGHVGAAGGSVERAIEAYRRQERQRLGYVAATRAGYRLYLPAPERAPIRSCLYRPLHTRIEAIREEAEARGLVETLRPSRPEPPGLDPAALAAWAPPLPAPEDPGDHFAEARARHAGVSVTSYSRLKRERETPGPEDASTRAAEPGGQGLPGGIATGLFLHELLEVLDYSQVRSAGSAADLIAGEPTRGHLAYLARRHGIDEAHWPEAGQLLWSALRTPLAFPGLALPGGLCETVEPCREMEFLFPWPESGHPSLGGDAPSGHPLPFRVGRGYLQGIIDLLFTADGRVFFLDWKSDRSSHWGPDHLQALVERHYETQIRLYTLAVARLLDIRGPESYEARFGGLLYCFLRGAARDDPGRGFHFRRPSFAETRAWERQLLGEGRSWV